MPFVKIKNLNGKKIFICEYSTKEDSKKDIVSKGEVKLFVSDTNKYILQLEDWNKSVDIIRSGIKVKKEDNKLSAYINPELISERGKKAIKKALETDAEIDWLLIMNIHNEERWSLKEYCCGSQIDYIKWQIQKLVNSGAKF